MTDEGRSSTPSADLGHVVVSHFPQNGDFAQRKDGNSNIHIVQKVEYDLSGRTVTMSCGQAWYSVALAHVDTDGGGPRDCRKCWDTF